MLSYFKNKVWKKTIYALLYCIVDITLTYVRLGLDSDYVSEVSNVANGPIIIFSYQIAWYNPKFELHFFFMVKEKAILVVPCKSFRQLQSS